MPDDQKDKHIRALEGEVARLQAMLQSTPDFITRITVDGNLEYLNRTAPGYVLEDVIGTSIDDYIPEQFRDQAHTAMRLATETREVQSYRSLGPLSSDRMGHYFTRVSPIVEGGEVKSLMMIGTDVTELEEQRTLLQLVVKATGLGTWTYDAATDGGTWDETAGKILGLSTDDDPPNLRDMLFERIHPDDRDKVAANMATAMQTGEFETYEHRVVHEDGSVRWVEGSGVPLRGVDGAVTGLVGGVVDITERRALEARLLQAEKLESIGRLAGGIAHDFNNMLTAILGNLDLALGASQSMPQIQIPVQEAILCAERSAALTEQLLTFARRQVIEPTLVDVSERLVGIGALLRRVAGEQISMSTDLRARWSVRVDPSQLDQVILNLVTNAAGAMPDGGQLTVQTRDVHLDDAFARRNPEVVAGDYVMAVVRDTGEGIALELLPHMFEPFFSTRDGGTGLGLATCYGIVRQAGGFIQVASTIGEGSSFTVYLPRDSAIPGAPEDASELPPEATPALEVRLRILVVEDEPMVRSIVERGLKRAGFDVQSAESADGALELVAAGAIFDLLVTDVVMPGMGGPELAKRINEGDTNLPVLFMSGYAESAIVSEGVVEPGVHFLQKPFIAKELVAAVSKIFA